MTAISYVSATLRLGLRVATVFVCIALIGCVSVGKQQGVANKWRDPSLAPFEKGKTTESDVIKALGPPSQLINLKDQTVFYYLREKSVAKGLILLIYNQASVQVAYDRAIFFFDDNGVLTEYSYSLEKTPYDAAK